MCGALEGDKLTLYTVTQGVSNCRHDNARDLGLADHQVQIICQYMGGGFGDKNGGYDVDLIAAMLAKGYALREPARAMGSSMARRLLKKYGGKLYSDTLASRKSSGTGATATEHVARNNR